MSDRPFQSRTYDVECMNEDGLRLDKAIAALKNASRRGLNKRRTSYWLHVALRRLRTVKKLSESEIEELSLAVAAQD